MSKKVFVAAVLLGGIFVFARAQAANLDIIINEIGAYPTSTHEWVEIWNKGSETVDLTGWKFWEDSTAHHLSASTTDSLVAPGEYAIISQDAEQFSLDYPIFSGSLFDSSWGSLNESGEEIGLQDAEGNFIERFTYLAAPNFSLERRSPSLNDYTPSNWQEHASGNTVGAINSIYQTDVDVTTTTTSSTIDAAIVPIVVTTTPLLGSFAQLRINEIVSNPTDGNEWVEFFNLATSSVALDGGRLCDNRETTSTCKILSGEIAAGGWLAFDLNSDSYFNNDGDSVILKNSDETVIDSVEYGTTLLNAPEKTQSLARIIDGIGEWKVTNKITAGAANEIVGPATPLPAGPTQIGASEQNGKKDAATTTKKAATTQKVETKKEKPIGLIWKVKYDPRLRVGEKTTLDASRSLDPRGGRANFVWDTGEGALLSGPQVDYVFASSGIHNIVISATTTAGTVDRKQVKIMVYPAELVAGAGAEISKIISNPAEDGDESVGIRNITSSSINISHWQLLSGSKVYEIPTSTIIMASDTLVFYGAVTNLGLNDAGDQVELRSADDVLVDEVVFGRSKEGEQYELAGGSWVWTDTQVLASATSTATSIITAQSGIEGAPTSSIKAKKASSKKTVRFVGGLMAIAEARELPKGSAVKLRGVVTVLPGTFGSQYFYISDGAAGIQVYQYKKQFPPLVVGDAVEARGELSAYGNIKRLKISGVKDVDILSTQQPVTSTSLLLEELEGNDLGGLVGVSGEITEIKSNFMYVDDGTTEAVIYFKRGAKIDKSRWHEGEAVSVVGVLEQGKNNLEIWPRSNEDVVVQGLSVELLQKQQLAAEAGEKETAEKYLAVTAGGVTTLLLGLLARARGVVLLSLGRRAVGVAVRLIRRG